jgi:hypothetical protein
VDAWIKKVKIPDQHKEGYATFMAKLSTTLKGLPDSVRSTLGDKAASLGLPIGLASKAKHEQLLSLLALAVVLMQE